MKHINEMFEKLTERFESWAKNNSVMSKPISNGDCHVIPLCELRVGFGGGGGGGNSRVGGGDENEEESFDKVKGGGMGSGGGVQVTPVAAIIIEKNKVRLELLDQ